jgi:hypothetical protein
MGIPVTINHTGPYEFLVDTGAQLTIIEPSLAEQLQLTQQASIGVISVSNYAKSALVIPDLIESGPQVVHQPLMAVQGLGQIKASNPQIRGILGETFLAHFDLLIDYAHKILCLGETKEMQQQLQGERLPLVPQPDRQSDLPYTQPLLVSVHLPGDGRRGTILRLDSGTNAPLLFASRQEQPSWILRSRTVQGNVAGSGHAMRLAALPSQEVKLGAHMVRQITFLTPVTDGDTFAGAGGEDGLLPTSLFKRVFISYSGQFAMLEPR